MQSIDYEVAAQKRRTNYQILQILQGYALETTRLLFNYAFEELGPHKIEALVLESNIGSLKMYKKCGYKERKESYVILYG